MGVRIGLGTDMTAYMQYEKLIRLGLMEYMDFIVSSEEAGTDKPGNAFFMLCARKADRPRLRRRSSGRHAGALVYPALETKESLTSF